MSKAADMAKVSAKGIFKNKIQYATSAINCLKNADCAILVTEWAEFKKNRIKHIMSFDCGLTQRIS